MIAQNNRGESLITVISKSHYFKENLGASIMNSICYPISAQTDSVIVRGIRNDLDQEVLRVTRMIKFDAPAMQRDKPIVVKYNVPVDSCLRDKKDIEEYDSCDCVHQLYNRYFIDTATHIGKQGAEPPLKKNIEEKYRYFV